ncbi:MAG: hypothetical protein HOK80_02130 [Candidatus Cloacimonetes bacterium]|nr:hypothetical protein [Candidatus Cloacimonadota bacterium]MBT4333037.1 hypothetical protein [Candidatus Cloacimonadota bacterium]MBT4576099.1 hypothetical protein [Candidatus Cloacimonadota bacterium]MBT5419660.1 hypothetical protein [Candidatus Cloacimonadota bacterium]
MVEYKKEVDMTNLFFRARSYYQYSYIWKIHNEIGGKFILTHPRYYDNLLDKVGKENVYLHSKRKDLPDQVSGLILEMTLNRRYYLKRTKQFKNVLIYHGMGLDKSFKGRNFPISRYDYYFVSGEKDYLKYKYYSYGLRNFNKRVVKIGHLRSDDIINKNYDIPNTLKQIGIKDRTRKNILYAPTWEKGHGSLLETYKKFCTQITSEYNLLIRTHPYDVKNYKIIRKFIKNNNIHNVYLIDPDEISLVNNLAIADLLIGENSSLMYDWLFFDKPLILVKTSKKDLEKAKWATQEKFSVFACGFKYNPEDDNINKLIIDSINNHPFADQIENVRNSTFYFNDGHANKRAINWINAQLKMMT